MASNKGLKFPPEVLNTEEVGRFFGSFRPSFTGARNAAIFAVCLRGLLRCDEALSLRPHDVDIPNRIITVTLGKGNKRRVVGIDETGANYLKKWNDIVENRNLKRSHYFCTTKGTRVHNSYVRAAVKRHATLAKISKRVHVHGFRHTGACQLCEEGFDVRIIQKALGHSSLSTTSVYLDHLRPEDVIKKMSSRTSPPLTGTP